MVESTGKPPEPISVIAAGPSSAEAGFTALDPQVIWLWRVTGLLGWTFLLLPLLGFAVGVGGFVWHHLDWALTAWAAITVILLAGQWWYARRAYRAWGYRLDDQVLELRSGVWFRVVRLLPLSRLQHVDLERGPFERALGLASLVVHTAGTQQASIGIPGLADAEAVRLRDALIAAGGDDGV